MAKWNYVSNDEILTNIQKVALNTINSIINVWEGMPAEAKEAAVQGVLDMVADIDEQIMLEKKRDDDK